MSSSVGGGSLQQRLKEMRKRGETPDEGRYQARLDEELGIIGSMEFPGYFLIVWDFIRFARDEGIAVGPGRGSGAGSLVAYSLRITDIDPLPYGLLFERFLNPERKSMPDFDIDFCMHRRDEVIRYVRDQYGHDNVGQIVTFGSLKSRSVVRDVGRAMGLSFGEVDKLAKLVPDLGPASCWTASGRPCGASRCARRSSSASPERRTRTSTRSSGSWRGSASTTWGCSATPRSPGRRPPSCPTRCPPTSAGSAGGG